MILLGQHLTKFGVDFLEASAVYKDGKLLVKRIVVRTEDARDRATALVSAGVHHAKTFDPLSEQAEIRIATPEEIAEHERIAW